MIQRIPLHLILWAGKATNGTVTLEFIDVTVGKSSRMRSEVYRTLLSAQIDPSAFKPIGCKSQCKWIVTRRILQKETTTFFKAEKWNPLQRPSQT